MLYSVIKSYQLERKEKGNIDHAHVICLMYNLLTTPGGYDDLSIGFHRGVASGAVDFTTNKRNLGKFDETILSKYFSWFC